MKKVLLVALTLLLLCTLGACSQEEGVPEGMQSVAVEHAPFDLFVPATWVPMTGNGVSGASVSPASTANVTVLTYFPDEMLDAATYWEKKAVPEYQNGVLQDFHIVEEQCGDTVLGGKDAKKYVYTFTMGSVAFEQMQIIAVKDDLVYILTYTATSTEFANHLEDVESIRSNFRYN